MTASGGLTWGVSLLLNVAAVGLIIWGALLGARVVWPALVAPTVDPLGLWALAARPRDTEGQQTARVIGIAIVVVVGLGFGAAVAIAGGLVVAPFFGEVPSAEERFHASVLHWPASAIWVSMVATVTAMSVDRDRSGNVE